MSPAALETPVAAGPPLVSLIVPVFNTKVFLADCVDSLLSQTYTNLEVILIDDGSTDASGSLCDEYARADSRVLVIHQANAGISEARNAGLRLAAGAWIMFVDSDDWLDRQCIAVLVDLAAERKAQIALCGTARATEPSQTRPDNQPDTEVVVIPGDDFLCEPGAYEPVHPVSACAKLLDRGIVQGIEFPRGRLHEDVFTTHRYLHRAKSVALTREVLHYYRQRPGSITAGTMSPGSALDKARAHLERASDLAGFGLTDLAMLEFRRGLGWHLRVTNALRAANDQHTLELAEQRDLVRDLARTLSLDTRARLAAVCAIVAPRSVARLYARGLARSSQGVHPIDGEAGS